MRAFFTEHYEIVELKSNKRPFDDHYATASCRICQRKTLHEKLIEKKVSTLKAIAGVATFGLTLLITGIKSDQESWICLHCQTKK